MLSGLDFRLDSCDRRSAFPRRDSSPITTTVPGFDTKKPMLRSLVTSSYSFSSSKIGCRNEGLRSMDASSPRIMAFGDTAITGGSHAPTPSYPRPQAGLPPGRTAPASPSPIQGLQTQDLGSDPLGTVAGRRRPDHLAVRRLRAAPRRPLRRDRPQGAAGHAPRLRHVATAAQRRAGRVPAQGAPQVPPAAGHRPDADPLPRPALP